MWPILYMKLTSRLIFPEISHCRVNSHMPLNIYMFIRSIVSFYVKPFLFWWMFNEVADRIVFWLCEVVLWLVFFTIKDILYCWDGKVVWNILYLNNVTGMPGHDQEFTVSWCRYKCQAECRCAVTALLKVTIWWCLSRDDIHHRHDFVIVMKHSLSASSCLMFFKSLFVSCLYLFIHVCHVTVLPVSTLLSLNTC